MLLVGADDRENEWIGEGMLLKNYDDFDMGLKSTLLIASKPSQNIMLLAKLPLLGD